MATMPPPGPPQPPAGPPPGQYPAGPPAFQPQYQQYGAYPTAAVAPRKRTAALLIAQILAIIEGSLFLLAGAGLVVLGILGGSALQNAINNSGLPSSSITNASGALAVATGVLIGFGVVAILYFGFFIWAAVIAGRPSMGGRITVIILDVILVLLSLTSIQSNNGITVGTLVFWAVQAIILYGMAIHGTVERRVT